MCKCPYCKRLKKPNPCDYCDSCQRLVDSKAANRRRRERRKR